MHNNGGQESGFSVYSNNRAEMSWGKKVPAFSPFSFRLYYKEKSCGVLELFFILTIALYSKILYVIHNVLLKQDTSFIYYWGNAKKMNFPLGTSNCQRNDCRFRKCAINMKYTLRREISTAHMWKG